MTYPHLTLALYGNKYQTKKIQYVTAILDKLQALGVQICVERGFADFICQELRTDLCNCRLFDSLDECNPHAAISIGGDGTFLGTAAQVGDKAVPILGINTGRLGFLADVSPDNVGPSLEALCRGDYLVEARMALSVYKDGGDLPTCPLALNEVAVLKHDNSSLIEISVYVDNHYLTNYLADGLIVSTPTGSTGYSLSVGGPILVPQSGTICISPVAPHSLSVRPVVVRDSVEIRLVVRSRSHHFLLSCDGRSESLPENTLLAIRRSKHDVKVIKIEHKHFFDTLRDKLNWGIDQRH